ncbi:hypothetical protein ACFL2V_06190 [Pseudomonadota bacterium]
MKFEKCIAALLAGAVFLFGGSAYAASCCGGGSSSSLIMPKMSQAMLDASFDMEHYDGFWNKQGTYTPDPPGSKLSQYRLNLGYAQRLASRWQASVALPYVWNDNQYSGLQTSSNGLGDMALNVWYEAFDGVTCVWKIKKPEDLKPAAYFGATLTVPTGISPYDDVANNFDITGRGLYRLDGNLLIEKTIYPWSASVQFSYGQYLERSVNREYGKFVEPYKKKLGDRFLSTASFGYTQFLDSMNTITYSVAYSDLREDEATINGSTDLTSGMEKRSWAATAAFATMDRDWVFKATWSPARQSDGRGENFPVTDIITLGVTHVLR